MKKLFRLLTKLILGESTVDRYVIIKDANEKHLKQMPIEDIKASEDFYHLIVRVKKSSGVFEYDIIKNTYEETPTISDGSGYIDIVFDSNLIPYTSTIFKEFFQDINQRLKIRNTSMGKGSRRRIYITDYSDVFIDTYGDDCMIELMTPKS